MALCIEQGRVVFCDEGSGPGFNFDGPFAPWFVLGQTEAAHREAAPSPRERSSFLSVTNAILGAGNLGCSAISLVAIPQKKDEAPLVAVSIVSLVVGLEQAYEFFGGLSALPTWLDWTTNAVATGALAACTGVILTAEDRTVPILPPLPEGGDVVDNRPPPEASEVGGGESD